MGIVLVKQQALNRRLPGMYLPGAHRGYLSASYSRILQIPYGFQVARARVWQMCAW
jgi:hypothetical protein